MKEARLAPKQTLQCATIRNLLVLAAGLSLSAVVAAENQNASRLPTWQDEIAKGFVPYRQLTVDETVVSYLATRIERSYAAVRQAVELLDSEALRLGRPVTRALAADLLRDA